MRSVEEVLQQLKKSDPAVTSLSLKEITPDMLDQGNCTLIANAILQNTYIANIEFAEGGGFKKLDRALYETLFLTLEERQDKLLYEALEARKLARAQKRAAQMRVQINEPENTDGEINHSPRSQRQILVAFPAAKQAVQSPRAKVEVDAKVEAEIEAEIEVEKEINTPTDRVDLFEEPFNQLQLLSFVWSVLWEARKRHQAGDSIVIPTGVNLRAKQSMAELLEAPKKLANAKKAQEILLTLTQDNEKQIGSVKHYLDQSMIHLNAEAAEKIIALVREKFPDVPAKEKLLVAI